MDLLHQVYSAVPNLLPALFAIALVLGFLWVANWVLLRRNREMGEERRFPRRITMLVLTVVGIVVILLALPVGEGRRDQLVTLLGVILTAVIAIASTTFVANAMAGLMLRTVRAFRPGDFVQVGDHFGRVTERGLFHTEIQTEDRDLTTLPNLYLVSNPVKVVRHSGTIVSATVSLGYDLPQKKIRLLLVQAAQQAGLQDPYVQILDLGDFSISYRVAGFLTEVKQLLTARSHLRSLILDTLHEADVEIVSPTFMNQRRLGEKDRALPPVSASVSEPVEEAADEVPEELIFDKAEEAGRLEQLRLERDTLLAEVEELEDHLKGADSAERAKLESEVKRRRSRCEAIAREAEGKEE
jgi:small-conductance mechanosensitive channel